MSQIKPTHFCVAVAMVVTLVGCGDKNDKVNFTAERGHPSGWAVTHKTSAKAELETCTECHGDQLNGGISQVSCTKCHLGSTAAIHPTQWGSYAYARHSAYVKTNGTATCAVAACHGSSLQGVSGSGPACASACHLGSATAKHPADWTVSKNGALKNPKGHSDYAKAQGSNSCNNANCHGTDAKGVFLSGPSCYLCHPVGPSGKHPADQINSSGHFTHSSYIVSNGFASCRTNICHGEGGSGTSLNGAVFAPSCSTGGCHK
jgi:hypothetical protein